MCYDPDRTIWLPLLILIVVIVIFILLMYYDIFRYLGLSGTKPCEIAGLDHCYYNKPRVSGCDRVVISLTTIPDRINHMAPTLASLLTQSHRVDEIQINLPYVSRRGQQYIIPEWLSGLKHVKVRRCNKDWGPSTKLLPTLQDESNQTCIIVVDDDMIYGNRFIYNIVCTFNERGQKEVITGYGHNYSNMKMRTFNYICGRRSYVDLIFGCSGFILKVDMVPPDVFNYAIAPVEVTYVDDHWFSGWLAKNKIPMYMMGSRWQSDFIPSPNCLGTIALSHDYNADKHNEKVTKSWFQSLPSIRY